MSKFIRIGVVSLYVFLTGFCTLLMLAVSGVYISWLTFSMAMAGWILFCGLAVYFLEPLFFYGQLRKPIMTEQLRLQGCLKEVLTSADCSKQFRLRITAHREKLILSSGHDTISVSTPLLDKLTDEELKGLLAHELGHLLSRDAMVSWSFATAGYLARWLRRTRLVWVALAVLPLLFFIVGIFSNTLIFPIGALWLFLLSSIVLDVLFRWWHRLLLRQREYSQDAFAHRLGYGRGLRDALVKLAQDRATYDRIHRLEQLIYQ